MNITSLISALLIFIFCSKGFCEVQNEQISPDIPTLIRQAFSRLYDPSPMSRFDRTMGITDYFGIQIRDTYSYTYKPNLILKNSHPGIEKEIDEILKGVFATTTGKTILRSFHKSKIEKIFFHVHVLNTTSAVFDSWTDRHFNVHIFISPLNYSKAKLRMMLIHELGQIILKFDRVATENLIKNNFSEIENIREKMITLLKSNRFTTAINTLRAFELESAILYELINGPPRLSRSEFDCSKRFREIAFGLRLLPYSFEPEQMEMSDHVFGDSDTEKIEEFIFLTSETPKFEKFCQELKKFEFSDTPLDHSGSGPRPNIGGGDGT